MIKGDIFTALGLSTYIKKKRNKQFFCNLGLKIQGGIRQENEDGSMMMIAEITKVTPGSIADNCGQLQIGKFSKKEIFILVCWLFLFR
jgi:hypothetical protein